MKEIPLTGGAIAIVDDEDYPFLTRRNRKWKLSGAGYATRIRTIDGQRFNVMMHRMVMNAPKDKCVDHINGNPLDNRKCNLRFATQAENSRNRKITVNKQVPYKGVRISKNKFSAQIRGDGKWRYLGSYATAEEAALAYNLAAVQYFGEFAKLNPIPQAGIMRWPKKLKKSHYRNETDGYWHIITKYMWADGRVTEEDTCLAVRCI